MPTSFLRAESPAGGGDRDLVTFCGDIWRGGVAIPLDSVNSLLIVSFRLSLFKSSAFSISRSRTSKSGAR